MDLRGKKVLVFGTGISGIGAGALLERAQASVILYDGNENLDKENLRKHFAAESSVEILLGSLPLEVMDQLELVVLSPGVPTDLPLVNQLREREIPIWGEVELAYRFASGEVLAITGTNGKTTTTALLGEIMKAYRDSVFVVGNIGTPYTGASLEMKEDSVTVAEMSSFQSAGDDRSVPSKGKCDLKYYTRSFKPTSYDGGIYSGERGNHKKSDRGRCLCTQL